MRLLVALCLALALKVAEGQFSLQLDMVQYKIPDDRTWNGGCCDVTVGWFSTCDPKKTTCDLAFRICLEPIPQASSDVTQCSNGWMDTGLIDNDIFQVDFTHKTYGAWNNPTTLTYNTPFQGMRLKVLVRDVDKGLAGADDDVDRMSFDLTTANLPVAADTNFNFGNPRPNKDEPTNYNFNVMLTCVAPTVGPDCRLPPPTTIPPPPTTTLGYCEQSGNPCLNSGTCVDYNGATFHCVCPPAYTGRVCETALATSTQTSTSTPPTTSTSTPTTTPSPTPTTTTTPTTTPTTYPPLDTTPSTTASTTSTSPPPSTSTTSSPATTPSPTTSVPTTTPTPPSTSQSSTTSTATRTQTSTPAPPTTPISTPSTTPSPTPTTTTTPTTTQVATSTSSPSSTASSPTSSSSSVPTSMGTTTRFNPCMTEGACMNGGTCEATSAAPYFYCQCLPWFAGSRCQTLNCVGLPRPPAAGTSSQSDYRLPPTGLLNGGSCTVEMEVRNSPLQVFHLSARVESAVVLASASVAAQSLVGTSPTLWATFFSSNGQNQSVPVANNVTVTLNRVRVTVSGRAAVHLTYTGVLARPCVESGRGCVNGGTCADVGSYSPFCLCTPCFSGSRCQTVSLVGVRHDPCLDPPFNGTNFCGHGTCTYSRLTCGSPKCSCAQGWTGVYCETRL